MVTLPLKLSCNEQYAIIRFLWAEVFNTNGDKCFLRSAIHVSCTKFPRSRESIVDEERPGWHVVAMTDATIATVDAMGQMFERTWTIC